MRRVRRLQVLGYRRKPAMAWLKRWSRQARFMHKSVANVLSNTGKEKYIIPMASTIKCPVTWYEIEEQV